MTRIALVLIHGIGEQRPMATLREFVSDIFSGNGRSKPDRYSKLYEVRRLNVGKQLTELELEVDCYELYWAHHMRDSRLSHLITWMFRLVFTKPEELEKMSAHLRGQPYLIIQALIIFFLGILILVAVATVNLQGWIDTALATSFTAILIFASARIIIPYMQTFIVKIAGDAARYLDNTPDNIGQRQAIREQCVEFLQSLNDSNDPSYSRIVVVGHSLGSVIAYDALKLLWAMLPTHAALPISVTNDADEAGNLVHLYYGSTSNAFEQTIRASKAAHGKRQDILISEKKTEVKNCRKLKKSLQNLQHKLFNQMLPETNWKISDFVTIGSPLAHGPILLAGSQEIFRKLQEQRELPTCPPESRQDVGGDNILCGWSDKGDQGTYRLHHAALFAVVRWTNFFFEGDPIGGPVSPLFGKAIYDVSLENVVETRKWRNHTRYWKNRGDTGSSEFLGGIRCIIDPRLSNKDLRDKF